jgi:uncharacterized membrane protein
MDNNTLMWLINGLLAILFFVLTFMMQRLAKVVDGLVAQDSELIKLIQDHREDVLRNYVHRDAIEPMKKDIIGRVDRLEAAFTRHSEEQDRRVVSLLESLRDDLKPLVWGRA